ncbi:DNA-directed RNA polymerase III subunit RPC3-like isoform X1 [Convolutriloba macropyga]|uniref:DNA-directed RNA polymerase III subunit RPC3-like isoform X1 n=1 Tax=Convolutriloba macropyga TaxID=536237 RepID=UPI003F51C4EA
MSYDVIELCRCVLTEHFGPMTARVGCTLLDCGPLTLPQICVHSKLRNPRKYLSVLVRHGIVSWDNSDYRGIRYTANENSILCRMRVASLVRAVGKDKGQLSELICEEVLLHGAVTEAGLIESVVQRALANVDGGEGSSNVNEQTVTAQVKTSFKHLSMDSFIHLLVPPDQELDNEEKADNSCNGQLQNGVIAQSKTSSIPLLWKVNLIRLQRCLLNHTLLDALQRRFGGCPLVNEVMRTVINLVEESEMRSGYANSTSGDSNTGGQTGNSSAQGQLVGGCDFQIVNSESVSVNMSAINQSLNRLDKAVVSNYMLILSNDRDNTGFVRRVGDAGGGQYVIDWYWALRQLTISIIQGVIRERFGGESVRIFNVLMAKGFSEQSEVEKFCLLAGKDVKQQLYTMLGDGFLVLAEIPRVGNDYAPSRTSYFYSVDLHRVAGVVLSSCVQTIRNLVQRRNHEVDRQQNLLDKNDRLENLKDSMRAKVV